MSRLDDLIAELCPDGVGYKRFGDVATILRGGSPRPIRNFITNDDNGVNWIKIGDVDPNGKYITSANQKIIKEGVSKSRYVQVGDFVLSNSMSFGRPYILKIDGCIHDGWLAISDFSEAFISDFLYHLLSSDLIQKTMAKKASNGTVKNLNADIVKSIVLPVPPLPIQQEIVRILDNFTELTAQLTAEHEARKKQYEYYRDELLTFGDDVEWKALEEEFPFVRNGFVGTATPFYTDEENGVRYLRGINIHDGILSDNEVIYVNKEFHQKHIRSELKADDILMVQSGHVGESAVVGEKYVGANCHALIVMSNNGKCNSKFINYYFQSYEGKKKLRRITTGGTIKHILASKMKEFKIPVPPIEMQNKIVEILDNFNSITNDITQGLPAEIEARQKQYEYYRDKLLTFKEKVS